MKYIYVVRFDYGEDIAFSSMQKVWDYMWDYFHDFFVLKEAEELCSEMADSIKENSDRGFELECGICCDMIEFKG
jgi:hypothetical protein